jgi:hypothetical protein
MRILLLIPIIFASCASYRGNSNTGEYSATIFATNHTGYRQSSEQLSFDSSNQSQAALSAIRTVGTVAGAWITMKGMLGISDNSTKEVTNASDNALKSHQASEVTKRAALQPPSQALP